MSDEHDTPVPIPLPPALATFLEAIPYGCLIHTSNSGAVLIAKLPRTEIEAIRGRVPASLCYELYRHQSGPVLRLLVGIHDSLENPLQLEVFINPVDRTQVRDFMQVVASSEIKILFYDEDLMHCLSKTITQAPDLERSSLLGSALRLSMAIPIERRDFARAKADIMRAHPL